MKYVLLVYVDGSRKVPENNTELTDTWVNGMDSRGIRLIGSELRPTAETTTGRVGSRPARAAGWPLSDTSGD